MNIYIEFPWTWAEYSEEISKVMPMLKELDYPCATVVDTTNMRAIPKDGNIIQVLIGVDKAMPDNLFASVIVGRAYSIQVFMNTLMRMRPQAKRVALFTDTMEEAYCKIQERYEALYPDASRKIIING